MTADVMGRVKSTLTRIARDLESKADVAARTEGLKHAEKHIAEDASTVRAALQLIDAMGGEVDEGALEKTAKALWERKEIALEGFLVGTWETASSDRDRRIFREEARAAITAYLQALKDSK